MTEMEFIHSAEVISDRRHFFCALGKKNTRACHTRWQNLCSIFDYFDGTNPITGKGIQLRSPAPNMAPGPHEL